MSTNDENNELNEYLLKKRKIERARKKYLRRKGLLGVDPSADYLWTNLNNRSGPTLEPSGNVLPRLPRFTAAELQRKGETRKGYVARLLRETQLRNQISR